MKRVGILLVALLAFSIPSGVEAQEVVDTITVDVYGEPTAITVSGPLRGYVGDTLTFSFEIVDADGEPSMGVTVWGVANPAQATIVEETDSTVSVQLLARGRLTLTVTVNRITSLRIGAEWLEGQGDRTGMFRWASDEPFQIQCPFGGSTDGACDTPGPALQMCAVGYSGTRPIFASHQTCIDQLESELGPLPSLRYALQKRFQGEAEQVPLYAFKNVYPTGIPDQLVVTDGVRSVFDRYVYEQMPVS